MVPFDPESPAARFIEESRTDIPDLLAEVERLKEDHELQEIDDAEFAEMVGENDILRRALLEGWCLGTDMEGEHCGKWYFINELANEMLVTDSFDTPEGALDALIEKMRKEGEHV